MYLTFLSEPPSDGLVIPLAQDSRLAPQLESLAASLRVRAELLQAGFQGEWKEQFSLLTPLGRIWLLGLGKSPGLPQALAAFRSLAHRQRRVLPASVAVELREPPMPRALLAEAAVGGLVLGRYDLGLYKTGRTAPGPFLGDLAGISLIMPPDAEAEQRAIQGRTVAEVQLRVMDLVNRPANKLFPADLAAWAKASGEQYGYHVSVLEPLQMESLGMHALLAVARGSENPPAFIVAEHLADPGGPVYGLAGKGVTFDTGGISIKDSANMHYMKCDMAGAAAVLGAVELAARLQAPVNLVAVAAAAENMIGPQAVRPGDVIGSYAGKTVEVIDTDAEGRLLLADALAWLGRTYTPSLMIDLATLTGSCVAALGYHAAGLFTGSEALAQRLLAAGDRSGERLWRLPLWEAYGDELKSDVADVKNFHGKPVAGAIVAAKFLEAFTDEHPAWAHLDIAGTAYVDSEFASFRSASAYGVRLLASALFPGFSD